MTPVDAPAGAAGGEAAPTTPPMGNGGHETVGGPLAERLVIVAPTGADGPVAEEVLAKWGISATPLGSMAELCDAIGRGVGAVLLAEEALRSADRERFLGVLDAQPSWSDVPVIVLTGEGELGHVVARGVEEVARRGNVTLLERPVRVATLALAVRAALRARRRQYELRDQIIERERLVAAERRARTHAVRLQELTAGLSVASTPAEVVAASVEHAARAVGAVGVVIVWVDEQGIVETYGGSDMTDALRPDRRGFRLDSPVPLAEVARTGEAVFLESPAVWLSRYPALAPVAAAAGHQAKAVLPLIVEGRPVGALELAFAQPNDFPAEERHLVLSIARQCALALARARLYEAERRARREADEANRAKAQFLAVMSHELRTPLNAIAGYAELMAMGIHGPVTPEQEEALRRVMKSEQHLLGLINAVLNYARIENGNVRFDIEDVPVDEVLATCETFVTLQARAKALRLELPPPDPSLVLHADREKVQQILLNLLSNAIKFTARGGRVSVARGASGGADGVPMLTIAVTDTGRGIPVEKLDAIFEPFVQVDVALTRTQDGVGLGLAISRELARAMHGDLHAASVAGRGTTLTLTLPRATNGRTA